MTKCVFCSKRIRTRILLKNRSAFAIFDNNPVTNFHTLIITKKHKKSFFELEKEEIIDIYALIKRIKNNLFKKDKKIFGYNFGVNYGSVAGQTIGHCHFHLIPRRKKDFDLRLKKNKKNFFWIK